MNQAIGRTAVIFSIGLVALHIIGFFIQGIFTWGFHALGFFPVSIFIVYGVLAFGGIVYVRQKSFERLLTACAGAMANNPSIFLTAVIALFVTAALVFRVQVPLLGDSFILLKLYQNALAAGNSFPPSHQPLSLGFFFLCIKLSGTNSFPQILNAFLAAELILGIAFILTVYATVRELFDHAITRCCVFLLLLVLPYIQLFFGYAELYSALLLALAVYILISTLYLHSKLGFYCIPPVFAVLVLVHYMNLLLLPSLMYLGFVEFRQRRLRNIVLSALIVSALAVIGILLLGTNIQKFIPPPRPTPILTIPPAPNDIYQAYTLFSTYHFIDLANLIVLLCPAGFFLIVLTFLKGRHSFLKSDSARMFLIALVPVLVFFAVAKFDLPMAQDWDVPAAYAYLLTLAAAYAASQWLGTGAVRAFSVLLLVTCLNSCTYMYLNASVEPNIGRVASFIDTRIASHDGCYQSTLHFTEYFVHQEDTMRIMKASERFIALFPSDKRGYSNYTLYLQQFGKPMDRKIEGIFDDWLRIDSANKDAREQYANFHLDIGNRSYHEGAFGQAKNHFEQAIQLNPGLADAYNSLGMVQRKLGQSDSALVLYQAAISLDAKNVYACINIGNVYDDLGYPARAIEWYQKAIAIQPDRASTYYNLGIAFYKQRMFTDALNALQHAARLGEPDARSFLRQHGERW